MADTEAQAKIAKLQSFAARLEAETNAAYADALERAKRRGAEAPTRDTVKHAIKSRILREMKRQLKADLRSA